MKQLATLLIVIALTPCVVRADDPKAEPAAEKKAEPAPAPAKGQGVLEVVRAIGEAIQEKLAPAVEAEADPIVQQFMPQFRQLLTTELHFVRTVCQPTPEQYQSIKTAGDASLRVTINKFAEVQKKMNQGFRAGQQPEWPDPRKLLAEGLARSVKQTLPADQAKRYEVELEKRAAARKRVAVINLVAKLDKDLVLTAEQRNKLSDSLNSNWKDAWCQQLEVFLYGDQFFPALPDDQVLPILNDKQKEIWKGTTRNQNTFWGWAGLGFVQAVEIEEEVVPDANKPDDKDKDKAEKKQEKQP